MIKIGILTLTTYINYGNRLQLYAIHRMLNTVCKKKKQVDTIILEFDNKKKIESKPSLLKTKRLQRTKVFKEFSSNCFNEVRIKGNNEYKMQELDKYDYIIIGSDQVFNPALKYPWPFDFCSFLNPDKIIVLSGSFGRCYSGIEPKLRPFFKKGLSRIKNLSVREKTAQGIVYKLTGKESKLILDPCLFGNKRSWGTFANRQRAFYKPDKYIFTYFLNQKRLNPEVLSYINRLSKREDLKVINCNDPKSNYFFISPYEFVDLIRHATYVITNSFHGLCFSVIFEKQFLMCDINTNLSVQSRIDDLLDILDLKYRKFQNAKNNIDEKINFNSKKLLTHRAETEQFLKKSLGMIDNE